MSCTKIADRHGKRKQMSANREQTVAIGESGRAAQILAAKTAVARAIQIEELAALIRAVDGSHMLGAAALAEGLVDRGVAIRRRPA